MRILKRIDSYTLVNFLKLFSVTFFICLFVFLMQFLWKYVDDMVGKGLGISVLAEFFMYAAVSLVPLALPMSIMLASLMSYGNMGEQLELLAMKSAGISLFRIMRPLIIVISMVCVGAFFFSNYVLPKSQTKMYTLLLSMRQKSPELEIPTGEFYQGISGYTLFVGSKDIKGQLLKNVIVYDFSNGFSNASVMLADSGRLVMSSDKHFLTFYLYSGESFENLQQQQTMASATKVPYRREVFSKKQIIIDFDASFTRFSESLLKNEQISKNVIELNHTIDSLSKEVKQLVKQQVVYVPTKYLNRENRIPFYQASSKSFKFGKYNTDSLFLSLNLADKKTAVNNALNSVSQVKGEITFSNMEIKEKQLNIRRHAIEWHRKFALSFACLIFFFIGVPLGAIIRKGGFGMPVVISVLMFIVYYIVDNAGTKMAREGFWPVWRGMWLSSSVLLPVGIFLTYKAVGDSVIMNPDAYIQIIKSIRKRLASYLQRGKKYAGRRLGAKMKK
ncbi:MAG: permease YjgP/YjgQ family protein [Bacteroidetes bacterium]|nr:permease YjgP/YjgQ family protein [Bacteroidota bacterium]